MYRRPSFALPQSVEQPVGERLARLRQTMKDAAVDAVMVPSSDPHLSEYLPGHWQGRHWFSGFSGSAGTLIVTALKAALFADSRYWVQAEAELKDSGIALEKITSSTPPLYLEWIGKHLARGQTLAVDGDVLGLAAAQKLAVACQAHGISLKTDADPLAQAWQPRPEWPCEPLYEHPMPYAAVSRADKLAAVRQALSERGATHHFISTLDDIAWLTNLRGGDVPYNPVFLAHLMLSHQQAALFVDARKLNDQLVGLLAADGITVADYDQAKAALAALEAGSTLLIDPKRITLGFRNAVPAHVQVVEAINPSTLAKSRKTAAQAAHVREAMVEDGIAMCRFYAGFEAALARGERLSETTVDARLGAERARRPGFVDLSFGSVVAFNANAAMPHYSATPDRHAVIEGPGLLLIDSGGQYFGGTTDVTRVWAIGAVTREQKTDCTLVLKAVIELSRTRFPEATPAPMLDALARAPLWSHSLDYGHSTGHGVGYFLNVHEGPQNICPTAPQPDMAMLPGMITSIEPGIYRPGRWGVRIENLVLNVDAPGSEFGKFLEFETLTLCPIDTRCIDTSLLRADEIEWLNRYHATVRERLWPHLDGAALAWLGERTRSLPV